MKNSEIKFDGQNKIIYISNNDYDMEELYSAWKRWVLSGSGAPYLQAFQMTSNDIIIINGWTIEMMD